MNKNLLFVSFALLLTACLTFSCKDDDDDVPTPAPPVQTGAPLQVMMVFAPGQLGDGGYADRVFEGIHLLNALDNQMGNDTLSVEFISAWDRQSTREAMIQWAEDRRNPYYGNVYNRRLLVLTEPYMANWVEDIKDTLSLTDDVLMLKTSEDTIKAIGERTGLSDRLYGLNISAYDYVRSFCRYMREYVEWAEADFDMTLSYEMIPVFRLYPDDEVNYQDSLYIAIQDELGDETMLEKNPLSNAQGEGIFTNDYITSITTMAYNMAENMKRYLDDYGYAFCVVDLGAANTGWDYYLFGHVNDRQRFLTLMMDTQQNTIEKYFIDRRFDKALELWVVEWMKHRDMVPHMQWHGRWDDFCETNVPIRDE